jgi:MFS family permease
MQTNDKPETRRSTRLAFLVAGFGIACWAPLVPLAKERLGLDDGVLGALLLCLGLGSIVAMLTTGALSARFGSRPIIIVGGLGLAVFLPTLTIASTPTGLAIALALFGASLGSLDVAMNVHAVEVQKSAGRPLLSGFHAMYSVGGFAGPLIVTVLFYFKITPFAAMTVCSLLMIATLGAARSGLITTTQKDDAPLFALPRGVVLLIAALAAITYLVEGAVLDWGALLLITRNVLQTDQAGFGYMLFALAMTVGRLYGDFLVSKLGDKATLLWGGVMAISGFVLILIGPWLLTALPGFLLAGFGVSNVVPVLFRYAGSQTIMPSNLAVAAITTIAYAGVLIGPAIVGFVAQHLGLTTSFWMLALLLCAIPASAKRITQ